MHQEQEPTKDAYPLGRGYGHDYMRGGEVLGGYGYSNRDEYERPRGETPPDKDTSEGSSGGRPR
jgi:hypothetical protein